MTVVPPGRSHVLDADRLITAGSQSPTSTSTIANRLFWPVFTNSSTYSTQPTAIAALPAQAVIQYDHAFANPNGLPNAARAYAYGPPSAGIRRDKPANRSASARAPTVVSAIDTSLIGPKPASELGRLKIPTPMMLPMISATACGRPKPPPWPCQRRPRAPATAWRVPECGAPSPADRVAGASDVRGRRCPMMGGVVVMSEPLLIVADE